MGGQKKFFRSRGTPTLKIVAPPLVHACGLYRRCELPVVFVPYNRGNHGIICLILGSFNLFAVNKDILYFVE